MTILIIGASGFLGKYITKRVKLEKKYKILALTRRKFFFDNEINYLTCDIRNIKKIENKLIKFNPNVIIYLAWEGIPNLNFKNSYINLKNSIDFFDLVLNKTKCKKIIVSGSCLEYGKQKGECKESNNIEINSYFNWAKVSLFQYLSIQAKEKKIDLIWLRIFYAFGLGQRKNSLIPYLISSIKKNEIPKINNPRNKNDFIYVKDVAEAFVKAIELRNFVGVINLGSGKSKSVIDICKMIEKELNGTTKFFDQIKKRSSLKQDRKLWANMNIAKKILKWSPKYNLDKAINEIIYNLLKQKKFNSIEK